MTSPRRAKAHERMLAMLAVGFCLGSLATTYIAWRRTAIGVTVSQPQSLPEAAAVATAPTIGPADAPADPPVEPSPADPSPAGVATTDLETLRQKKLRIPIDGVTRAALQPSFAQLRGTRQHEAIDILAPRGTPVRAVGAGAVAKLFVSDRGGITVYQYDPSGAFCYYYAHLDRYADGLQEGQQIREGDLIGYVGTTGNAPPETPHLHFAIFRMQEAGRWWEGTAIDPYEVLQ